MLQPGPTSRKYELGVEPKHLQSEGDFVDDALAGRLTFGPEFKVLRSIVGSLAISVMRRFTREKWTAKHFLHDKAMFVPSPLPSHGNPHVSGAVKVAIRVAGINLPVGPTAFTRAELRGHIKAQQRTVFHTEAASLSRRTASLTNKSRWLARFDDLRLTSTLNRTVLLVRSTRALCEQFVADN